MKFLFTFLLLAGGLVAGAQKSIKLEDIAQHIGDSVTVSGKVAGGRYFADGKQSPTLLNVGAPFPNQLLTVVIYGDVRSKLTGEPEKTYFDKTITVSGKVELYKGKPQIIVQDPAQLALAAEAKQ
jgi:micrococcal nuclease